MLDFTLQTERLILRPFVLEDLADFFAYASVPGVGEQAGWVHHKTLEESRSILEKFIENKDNLALVDRASNRVIGSLGMHRKDSEIYPSLGYVLSQSYWGRGLMTEAMRAILDTLFTVKHWEGIAISHFIENIPSQRIIEKCGFRFVRRGPYISAALGSFDAYYYELTASEYQKLKEKSAIGQ